MLLLFYCFQNNLNDSNAKLLSDKASYKMVFTHINGFICVYFYIGDSIHTHKTEKVDGDI